MNIYFPLSAISCVQHRLPSGQWSIQDLLLSLVGASKIRTSKLVGAQDVLGSSLASQASSRETCVKSNWCTSYVQRNYLL